MTAPKVSLGLLLLALAAPTSASPPLPSEVADAVHFAPPTDRRMTYRVTTRRLGKDGALMSIGLVYSLAWQSAGRGYRLDATLEKIEFDAASKFQSALTAILEPLVGEPVAYLIGADGRNIDLIDPDGLWERVTARTHAMGAQSHVPEARQIAALLAALPVAERDRLITTDVRALVAAANMAIPLSAGDTAIAIDQNGPLRSVKQSEKTTLSTGGAEGVTPLRIDTEWKIDPATGLVVREHRQSWVVEAGTDTSRLVEERIRALQIND